MTARPAAVQATLPDRLGHGAVLAIAIPIILANVTTPLIGLVDTAVLGQLGDPHYIGGIAIGAMIFNLLYWTFGFLRMGTTGLTAQAEGGGDGSEIGATLIRALLIAVAAGVAAQLVVGGGKERVEPDGFEILLAGFVVIPGLFQSVGELESDRGS